MCASQSSAAAASTAALRKSSVNEFAWPKDPPGAHYHFREVATEMLLTLAEVTSDYYSILCENFILIILKALYRLTRWKYIYRMGFSKHDVQFSRYESLYKHHQIYATLDAYDAWVTHSTFKEYRIPSNIIKLFQLSVKRLLLWRTKAILNCAGWHKCVNPAFTLGIWADLGVMLTKIHAMQQFRPWLHLYWTIEIP